MKKILWVILLSLIYTANGFASDKTINLVVGYKKVYFAGKAVQAIAVNDQIPAPTLHFKEGDRITINVYNHLDQDTAIHWHGMLVPWQMDGVEGITQRAIPPGLVFHYQFTLKQAGTYWYHAHKGFQEQQGLYGSFIIDPPQPTHYKYNKDFVVVLSDWSNTNPDQILANLKNESDYYSPRFPLQPSLAKFIHDYRMASKAERQNLIDDYKMMQQMRMSIYDFNDVAYDAFLLNGHPNSNPWTSHVKPGETVRLRFIGAAADTIFRVKIPNAKMEMVHIQGNDIVPYQVDDFSIAPGETYDVLVKIEKNEPYIIYAESRNMLGAAFGALTTAPNQFVDYQHVKEFPEPLPVTREMMDNIMIGMNHNATSMMKPNNGYDSMSHKMKIKPGMNIDNMLMGTMSGYHMPSKHANTKIKETKQMQIDSHHAHTRYAMHEDSSDDTHMGHSMLMKNNHNMEMPTESSSLTMGTKYQNLMAAVKTNNPNKPIYKVINMELFGYMDRYI